MFYLKHIIHKIASLISTFNKLGLGRYSHQPYRYVFDTVLADTIRIRYDTYVHDLRFQNQEFGFQQQSKCFGLIYTVNPTNTSSKTQ